MPLRKRHGKWNIRFWVNGHEYTEPTDLAATERNRSAAARIEAELYGRVLEGKSGTLRLKVQPFREAAEQFLVWADSEHREHPNTGRRLRTSFVSLSAFFKSFAVSSITSGNVEDYKAWRRVEHKVREITLRHDLHALSKFYRYAIKHNWATENPVRGVTMPSDLDAVRMHVLTPSEEAQYFFTALSEFEVTHKGETHCHGPFQDLHDVAKLILLQGCRPDEILRLRPEHIDLERSIMRIERGKSRAARRTLKLRPDARGILAARLSKPGKWVFRGKKPGEPLTKVNGSHAKVLAATGLRFVLYDLRHTFATRMADAGCPLATLAAILGHANLRSISKYVHPNEKDQHLAMDLYFKPSETVRFWSGLTPENAGKPGIDEEVPGTANEQENQLFGWRRGGESNPRIKVLQTSALPLGYRAGLYQFTSTNALFLGIRAVWRRSGGLGRAAPPASSAGPRLMLDLLELLPLLGGQNHPDFQVVLRERLGQFAARRSQPVDRVVALGRIHGIFVEHRIHRGFRLVHFVAHRRHALAKILIHLVHLLGLRVGEVQLLDRLRIQPGTSTARRLGAQHHRE